MMNFEIKQKENNPSFFKAVPSSPPIHTHTYLILTVLAVASSMLSQHFSSALQRGRPMQRCPSLSFSTASLLRQRSEASFLKSLQSLSNNAPDARGGDPSAAFQQLYALHYRALDSAFPWCNHTAPPYWRLQPYVRSTSISLSAFLGARLKQPILLALGQSVLRHVLSLYTPVPLAGSSGTEESLLQGASLALNVFYSLLNAWPQQQWGPVEPGDVLEPPLQRLYADAMEESQGRWVQVTYSPSSKLPVLEDVRLDTMEWPGHVRLVVDVRFPPTEIRLDLLESTRDFVDQNSTMSNTTNSNSNTSTTTSTTNTSTTNTSNSNTSPHDPTTRRSVTQTKAVVLTLKSNAVSVQARGESALEWRLADVDHLVLMQTLFRNHLAEWQKKRFQQQQQQQQQEEN